MRAESRTVRQSHSVKIISPHLVCQTGRRCPALLSLLSSLSSPATFVFLPSVSSSLTDTEVEIINCEIFKTILLRAEVAEHQFVYFKRFMQLSSNKDGVESFPANFSFAVEYISSSCKIFFVVKHVQFLL